MIEAARVSKFYGSHCAVDDVSFHVGRGEVVGFLGPNGAGKTTTLRILAGFVGASRGSVRILGDDITEHPIRTRTAVGYMPEASPLYPEMRVREYLAFRAELRGVPRRKRREAVQRALSETHTEDVASVLVGHLSKGYRQRVGLADALVASPPILILDEPTAGLDPNQIREVRTLIKKLGEDRAVLLSTHILSEVEATCSRALVIAGGRLVAEGPIASLRSLQKSRRIRIVFRGEGLRALEAARTVEGIASAELEPPTADDGAPHVALLVGLAQEVDPGRATEDVVRALVQLGVGVREVAAVGASLEQAFSDLTEVDETTLEART